jgi:hypothetical protein
MKFSSSSKHKTVLSSYRPSNTTEHPNTSLIAYYLGPGFQAEKFGPREWNALRRQRASGEIDAKGQRVEDPSERKSVSPRSVAKTLKILRQVFRFGAAYRRREV